MSSDDLLARATRAMRESTTPEVLGGPIEEANDRLGPDDLDWDGRTVAATTLARIERSTRQSRELRLRKRTFARWVVLPMAASFLVFAAWASASGRLSRWMGKGHADTLAQDNGHENAAPTHQAIGSRAPQAVTPPEPSAPVDEPATSALAPSPSPTLSVHAAPKPAAKPVDVDALYRDAHEAHFVKRDNTAALAAWDGYLAAAGPSGRFALEARYNRAITLVRLGRKAEAVTALRPFANGEYGGYRRDEAAQLLQTLE